MAKHVDEKLSFDFRIPHRNWKIALSESFTLISMASPGDVICITGPSRVGKSRLVEELENMLNVGNDFEKTGILPVVRVRAVNQGNNGSFSTKAFAQHMLNESKHPIYGTFESKAEPKKRKLSFEHTSEAMFMAAFAEAIVYRRIRFLFIDEAQHVVYVSKDAIAPVAVMDSWKSFAEENNLVLIIVGAYPVLPITSKSTHMVGRIQRVHFPRYFETESDLDEFRDIVLAYQGIMNLQGNIGGLDDHLEMLYKGSLGCIGLLRKWLKTASLYAAAVDEGISMSTLHRAAPSASDYDVVQKEIIEGEHFLRGIFNSTVNEKSTSKAGAIIS
ncbi:MAG: ATP-binding protein [Gammaproteobacteria bacterium]